MMDINYWISHWNFWHLKSGHVLICADISAAYAESDSPGDSTGGKV